MIDIQTGFPLKGNKNTLFRNVISSIDYFKQRRLPVVSLSFNGHGPLRKPIRDPLADYDQYFDVEKDTNAGGIILLDALFEHNLRRSRIYMAGAYGEFCLAETAMELSDYSRDSKITILTDCVAWRFKDINYEWTKDFPNIKLKKGLRNVKRLFTG